MEDIPTTHGSGPLDLVPPEHIIPIGDSKSSDEYCEDTDTCHPLAELLEQFWQLKDHSPIYTHGRADAAHR